jgi:hypothetical protein
MSIRRLVLISFLAAACVAQLSTAQEITVAAGSRPSVCYPGCRCPIPKGNGKERETQFTVRRGISSSRFKTARRLTCSFRLISITEEARGGRTDGAWNLLPICRG